MKSSYNYSDLPGFNFANRTYTIRGELFHLTSIEIKILAYLSHNKGKVVTTKEIYEAVWNESYLPSANNTVMVHIKNLRKKLELNPKEPQLIVTAWGKGYMITN